MGQGDPPCKRDPNKEPWELRLDLPYLGESQEATVGKSEG